MNDNQGFEANQDGSITIELDGKKVKFVKESDLGAVKAALKEKDSEVIKLQTDLAGVNTKYDTEHQDLLKERASKSELEKVAGESTTLKQQVEDLTKNLAGVKEASGGFESKLAERLRSRLTQGFKIDSEKIKDKSLTELESMEQTLALTGYQETPANYDSKSGVGGYDSNELQGKSPLTLAAMGYAESKVKK